LGQLAATVNLKYLALATEEEVRELFPESEVGAVPPFGALFNKPVYLDVRLAEEPYILFNGGTHRDAIHISVADYVRVADPKIIQFAYVEPRLPVTEAVTRR
jgi:Ala-tRNA(Pro) deacylase